MKLNEIAGNDTRLAMLKLMIDRGERPPIADAYYSQGRFSWSDLEKLGYAKKGSEPHVHGLTSEWWTYTGPNAITVVTDTATIAGGRTTHGQNKRVLKSGQSTAPVEVDYS